MSLSLLPDLVAGAIAARQANTQDWQNLKSFLDTWLNKDWIDNPGGIYEASIGELIPAYALGYQCLKGVDDATANNYAYRALGVMANIAGASYCKPAYQKGTWITWQYLGIGDGHTTTFALPVTNPIAGSISIFAPSYVNAVPMTRGSGNVDVDGTTQLLYSLILSVTQGGTTYVPGVDYDRPGDQTPWSVLWYPGRGPAVGSSYSVMRAYSAGGYARMVTPSQWTYNSGSNSVVFATAPAVGQVLLFSCSYGNYRLTSFGDGGVPNGGRFGGFNSILIDGPGYTGRYLGKGLAFGLDWLDGSSGFDTTLRANAIELMKEWFNWTLANGYNVNSAVSNYGDGFYVSNVLSALALLNPGGSPRDSAGTSMVSTILNFRNTTVIPALTNSSNSVKGGFWAEGWSYGDLAAQNLLLGSYALQSAGQATVSQEQQWAADAGDSIETNSPTTSTIVDYGDTFAYPLPLISIDTLTAMAFLANGASAGAAARLRYVCDNWSPQGSSYFYPRLLFNLNLPTGANPNTLPLFRLDQGTGHYTFRSGWTMTSDVWVAGQCGNLLACDHQEYSPGELEIRRGADILLVNGNALGGNESPSTKSQYSNTFVVDANGNSSVQTYRYCMAFWYGNPGVSNNGLDTDGSTWASVVENFPTAYAPASPGNGTGGPCSALTRKKVFFGGKYLAVFDDCSTTNAAYLKQVRWHFGVTPTVATVSGGFSFQAAAGSSKLFGQTLSGVSLNKNLVTVQPGGTTSVQELQINNAANAASVSFQTVFQTESSTTSAMNALTRIVATDNSIGVQIGGWAVMRAMSASGVTYSYDSTAGVTHLCFRLTPNTLYNYTGGSASSNAAGTLEFTTAPGASGPMVISQGSAGAGQTAAPAGVASRQALGRVALSQGLTIVPSGISGSRSLGAVSMIGPYLLGPTLAITDNQNGSGATAVLSGGSPLAISTVQVQLPSQTVGNPVWQQEATVIGNGTLQLPLPPGYYWGSCLSDLGQSQLVSNIVWFPVTTNTDSVEYRVLSAVQALIQTLSLPGLDPSQVYLRLTPDPKIPTFPAIFITPEASETYLGGTDHRDDIGYPAVIWIANRNDKDYAAKLPMYTLWRERIQRFFRFQRLQGVPEIYTCKVEPREIVKFLPPNYAYLTSTFVLRFTSREVRGI